MRDGWRRTSREAEVGPLGPSQTCLPPASPPLRDPWGAWGVSSVLSGRAHPVGLPEGKHQLVFPQGEPAPSCLELLCCSGLSSPALVLLGVGAHLDNLSEKQGTNKTPCYDHRELQVVLGASFPNSSFMLKQLQEKPAVSSTRRQHFMHASQFIARC